MSYRVSRRGSSRRTNQGYQLRLRFKVFRKSHATIAYLSARWQPSSDGEGRILVANIASPTTVRNIGHERRVCLSFVNVFTQKGHKIQGDAMNIMPGHSEYEKKLEKIAKFIGARFPVISIIEIAPQFVEEIIAPNYRLFPETGRQDRIKESLETYQVSK